MKRTRRNFDQNTGICRTLQLRRQDPEWRVSSELLEPPKPIRIYCIQWVPQKRQNEQAPQASYMVKVHRIYTQPPPPQHKKKRRKKKTGESYLDRQTENQMRLKKM